jgi:hypothetical protein
MNLKQAYINGFVKRANEYGYSRNEAIAILKYANTSPQIQPNMMPSRASSIKSTPIPNPAHIPGMWNAPKASIAQNTAYAPEVPKLNITAQANNSVPENTVRELADVPLSNMTPKDHWVSGLHNILNKSPVINPEHEFENYVNTGTGYELAPVRAPSQSEIARNHTKDLLTAIKPGNSNPLLTPDNSNPRTVAIRDHLKQYDPSWGDSFRLPVKQHEDIPIIENDPNFMEKMMHNTAVMDFKSNRDEFNQGLKNYLDSRQQR